MQTVKTVKTRVLKSDILGFYDHFPCVVYGSFTIYGSFLTV